MKDEEIQFVREFNRFYTNVIGLVDQHVLLSSFSLPEARVLYEIRQLQPCTAKDIMAKIQIDKGYLSRVLAQFSKKKLLTKEASKNDGRAIQLSLTPKGHQAFEKLDQASVDQIRKMITNLSSRQKSQLIHHMKEIKAILNQHGIK